METVKISEQELINALCVYIAEKRQVGPEEVSVELMYDDDYGFSASRGKWSPANFNSSKLNRSTTLVT